MTPEQKAKELIEQFSQVLFGDEQFVNITKPKECALITVYQILGHAPCSPVTPGSYYEVWTDRLDDAIDFWIAVKEEINNL